MENDIEVFEAMQLGTPLKAYRKEIIGKLVVKALNPFDDTPMEVVLEGDPKKNEKGCFINLWSPKQVAFFERMNERFIQSGMLRPSEPWSSEKMNKVSNYTDKDILELFERPFIGFRRFFDNIYSVEFVNRVLEVAEKNGITKETYLKVLRDRQESLMSTITQDEQEYKPERKEKKPRGRPKKSAE